jgi:hypothetical protein
MLYCIYVDGRFFWGEVLDRIRAIRVDGGSRARGLSAAAGYGMDLRRFKEAL